jgi:hypothetical protein
MLDVVQLSHGIGPGMDGIRQADGHRVTRWKAADRISMLIQGVSHTHITNTHSHTPTHPSTEIGPNLPLNHSAGRGPVFRIRHCLSKARRRESVGNACALRHCFALLATASPDLNKDCSAPPTRGFLRHSTLSAPLLVLPVFGRSMYSNTRLPS